MRIRFFFLKNQFFQFIAPVMDLKNWFFKMEKIFSNTNLLFMNKTTTWQNLL